MTMKSLCKTINTAFCALLWRGSTKRHYQKERSLIMKKFFNDGMEHFKSSSTKEKVLTTGMVSIAVILACMAVKLAAPVLATLAIAYFFLHKDNTAQRQQQALYQQKQLMASVNLYEQVARSFFPILKEYNAVLGISPATVHSIYSEEKFFHLPEITEPVLVYTSEKTFPPMADMSDVKAVVQTRLSQENLDLYLARIDARDSQFIKFYILPIISEDSYNWALLDQQRQFAYQRPQKPGNRKDKDF